MLSMFDLQFADIHKTSPFNEEAKIWLSDGKLFTVDGLFVSGTFGAIAPLDSVTKTPEGKEFYWISAAAFGQDYEVLLTKLSGAKVEIPKRGKFAVQKVRGERSGSIQLELRKVKNGRSA